MTFEKAIMQDISMLTDLRIAYLKEDLGTISDKNLLLIKTSLPFYYEKHLNKDLMVYVARNGDDIVSCAFLLIEEKPMSPSFITGKTGTVLNVYTKPEYHGRGYAKKRMLERSKEYQKRCKEVCSDAEYYMLEKAFFDKENNLRK